MNIDRLRCYIVEHNSSEYNVYEYYNKIKDNSRYIIRDNSIYVECGDKYIKLEYEDINMLKEDFYSLVKDF